MKRFPFALRLILTALFLLAGLVALMLATSREAKAINATASSNSLAPYTSPVKTAPKPTQNIGIDAGAGGTLNWGIQGPCLRITVTGTWGYNVDPQSDAGGGSPTLVDGGSAISWPTCTLLGWSLQSYPLTDGGLECAGPPGTGADGGVPLFPDAGFSCNSGLDGGAPSLYPDGGNGAATWPDGGTIVIPPWNYVLPGLAPEEVCLNNQQNTIYACSIDGGVLSAGARYP